MTFMSRYDKGTMNVTAVTECFCENAVHSISSWTICWGGSFEFSTLDGAGFILGWENWDTLLKLIT